MCSDRRLTDTLDLNEILNTLPTAADALFNAYQRQHDPICLRDTRVDLLEQIYKWADGQDGTVHLLAERPRRHGEVDDRSHRKYFNQYLSLNVPSFAMRINSYTSRMTKLNIVD